MKKLKPLFHLAAIFLLLVGPLYSQNYWKFTVNPNTEGWAALTLKERIAAQQIPEGTLKSMTTDEVFQAWIDLPARLEVLAFNTMQKGFEVAKERYNVLPTLLQREDVGSIVLKRYLKIDPDGLKKESSPVEKGRFITGMGFVEFFLSQPEVLSSLTKTEKKQLFKTAMQNLSRKESYPKAENDFFWIESGLILAGRLLENDKHAAFLENLKNNKEIKQALLQGEITSEIEYEKLYEAVMSISKNY